LDEAGQIESREAAYRSQSKNNIKQMALALHNFLAVNNSFPAGTHPIRILIRRSGSVGSATFSLISIKTQYSNPSILRKLGTTGSRTIVKLRINMLLTPGPPDADTQPAGVTNYVGIAGVVKTPAVTGDGFTCRHVRLQSDDKSHRHQGWTSNTIMVTEAKQHLGPWIAGGRATIRSLTSKPYINGPDGSAALQRGMNVGIGDGSVRFISEISTQSLGSPQHNQWSEPIPALIERLRLCCDEPGPVHLRLPGPEDPVVNCWALPISGFLPPPFGNAQEGAYFPPGLTDATMRRRIHAKEFFAWWNVQR